jgi:hypothetical protein
MTRMGVRVFKEDTTRTKENAVVAEEVVTHPHVYLLRHIM